MGEVMIKVKAQIELYIGQNKRKTPFESKYRPLFGFSEGVKTSGIITLLDRKKFFPGDKAFVEIRFLNANCSKGTKFLFYEGTEPLGEGVIIEVLGY